MEILKEEQEEEESYRVLKYIYAPRPDLTSRPEYAEKREIWAHILLDNNRVLIVSTLL